MKVECLLSSLATFLLCSWAVAAVGDGSINQGPAEPQSREIAILRGVPIASQLRPDDQLVLVQKGGMGPPLVITGVASLNNDLDRRARETDIIVLAEPIGSEAFLVDNGSWIDTRVTLRPLRVLKDTTPSSVSAHGTITFVDTGGEMRINSVLVRAGYFFRFNPCERYLVFLHARSGTPGLLHPLDLPFHVTQDERLEAMDTSTGLKARAAGSALYGLELVKVISELTRRLQRR